MSLKTFLIFLTCMVFFGVSLSGSEHSLQFSQDGQYLDCENLSYYNLNNLTNNLTIEAWIYPTDFKDDYHMNTIASKVNWTATNTYGWTLRYGSSSRTLNLQISGGGAGEVYKNTWVNCIADNVLTLNTWQHVAATYNGSEMKLYINGTEVSSNIECWDGGNQITSFIPPSIAVTTEKKLIIGALDRVNDLRNMTGSIDQVRIWNVARSQSQIADNLYNSVTSDNLLAEFLFNTGSGTILVNSANSQYNATLVNASWSDNVPYYSVSSETDKSLQFNQEGQYVDCGNTSYYNLSNNLTLEAWIYPTDFKNNYWESTIVSRTNIDPAETYGWGFCYGSAKQTLNFHICTVVGSEYWVNCTADNVLTLNTWQHVAATYNGSEMKLYVNGAEVASFNHSSSIPNASKKLRIGAIDHDSFYRNMLGSIDQVRIWNVARSQTEIADNLYNSVTSDNLLADFQFNSSDGNLAINNANSNYNSIIQNAPTWSDNVPYYSVDINTGNISGVNISIDTEDYGNDPGTISLVNGFSGTVSAQKDNYIWSLASGSDSNILSNLNSNRNISFVGTFTLDDPVNTGFTYSGQEDVQLTASEGNIETLGVPSPTNTTESDIVMVFTASTTSDLNIAVPAGTWYVIAYYNDAENGGLTWHQGNPYPATGPTNVVFSNLPFAGKGDVPVIISPEDSTLPVTFASFTGSYSGDYTVSLDWVTHSESDLNGFNVLRAQENDLVLATQVGSMVDATNTSLTHNYSFVDNNLKESGSYYYWLKIIEFGGDNYYHGPITIDIEDNFENPVIDIPQQTRLHNAYPNPFNPSTTISYTLKEAGNVKIEVFDIKGRKIWDKSVTHDLPGLHSIVWNGLNNKGKEVASGLYYCRLSSGNYRETNKMVLLK
ncbi:T9SS type A sorting domain-containing protein [bacterium]|nr:T9SS type A sorting domain-containing protein [bacterium]